MTYPPPSPPSDQWPPGGYSAHPPSAEPQPAGSGSRRRVWMWLVGAVVLAVVASMAIATATGLFGTREAEQAGGHSANRLSGDRDEWTAAVCEEGSVSQPTSANFRFPDAVSSAYCTAKPPGAGGVSVSLMIGEWPSDVAVGDELARFPSFQQFAAGPAGDRTIVFAPISSTDRSLLEPLRRFGFTIVSLS